MVQVKQTDFYPVLYGGLLGGAAHSISDSYLVTMLPTEEIEALGISIKDIALIYLSIYASKNYAKKAWQKQSLEGMAVISVYKTIYPRHLEPMVAGLLKKEG